MTRQRIEAVLKKHGVKLFDDCLTDLLTACQPSREELEKLANGWEFKRDGGSYGNQFPPELLDDLMAWASGTGRTWCECIEWVGGELRPWRYKPTGEIICGWNFCQNCGTRRPD